MTGSPNKQNESGSGRVKKFWFFAAFIGVGLVLLLMGLRLFQENTDSIEPGKIPQDFELVTFSGERIQTSDLRGKVVLINFWASWCTTCDEEAVMLEDAWQFFQTESAAEVAFMGVAYMDTETASLSFLTDYGVTYPNGPDLGGEISNIYQVNSVPETYILDQDGTLQYVKFGPFVTREEIIAAIRSVQLLKNE